MAIYHCSIKIISRGKGKSAVAAAAYRAGEKIINNYDGQIHDYTKKGGVIHTEILLPTHAPKQYFDRAILWNSVEQIEANRNSQLAREIEIALPKELSMEQNIILARDYVQKHFVDKGMCADLCVHDTGSGNPHAHIMLTIRPIEQDGSWGAKSRKEYLLDVNGNKIKLPSGEYKSRKINTTNWNEQTKAEEWRKGWADSVNAVFAKNNIAQSIDHRSYERQGIDKIPTIHLGVAASQMERKGIATDRGNHNRGAEAINSEIRQTKARLNKVKNWLFKQPLSDNLPTLIDIMGGIANAKNLNTHWQRIRNIQTQASVLLFLSKNNIDSVEAFIDNVIAMHKRLGEVSDEIKKAERRLTTLAAHLVHAENHKKHKALYQKYKGLSGKQGDAFCEKHSDEIGLYEDAKRHFDGCMNGRKVLPVREWEAEQKELLAKRYGLCDEFYSLQGDVKSVEVLRRGLEAVMREKGGQDLQVAQVKTATL